MMKLNKYHSNLSNYFTSQPLFFDGDLQKKPNIRKCMEQPWQQTKGHVWNDLILTLSNLNFLEAKCAVRMTDDLLKDYYEAADKLTGDENITVSAFKKFIQENASYLRSYSGWCHQLAIIEPPDSPVGKKARQIAASLSLTCLEPVYLNSTVSVHREMRFIEHKKRIKALAFDSARKHLVSSDGEEAIRWDIGSAAIISRFTLPLKNDVVGRDLHGNNRWDVVIADKSASLIIGNVLVDAYSGREIRSFINQRMIECEWTAPPAISPDSSMFALCTQKKHKFNEPRIDHAVTVVSSDSGKVISELLHTGRVDHALFSPDSRLLVTTQDRPEIEQGLPGGKNLLRAWNIHTNDKVFESEIYGLIRTSFSPDCKILFALDGHTIYGLNTSDWSQLFKINDVTEHKTGILFIDNTFLLSWGRNSVTLWNIRTQIHEGRLLFGKTRKSINTIILSEDRQKFAIGFDDGLIELWNLETLHNCHTSEELYRTDDDVKIVKHLTFSPNNKQIAFSDLSDQIGIVDVERNTEVITRKLFFEQESPGAYLPKEYQSNKIESLRYLPDGKSLILMMLSKKSDKNSKITAFGYSTITFGSVRRISATDLTDQAVFEYQDYHCFESSVTPDGYCIFVRFNRDNLIQLRIHDLSIIRKYTKDFRLHWILSPDGSKLVYTNTVLSFAENNVLYQSDKSLPFFNNPVFSPDGLLVAVNQRNKIALVNITGKSDIIELEHSLMYPLHLGDRSKNDFIFSPDGRKLLLIDTQVISIVDIRNGKKVIFERSHPKNPEISCRFSPDSHLVIGIEKDFINVWNADSGFLMSLLPLRSIDAFDFSPDGSLLCISQGGSLRFFQLLHIKKEAPFITPTCVFQFNPKINQNELTVDCPHCGVRFVVPASIPDIIHKIKLESGIGANDSPCLKLPDKAWDEHGLLSECLNCGQRIRFNPFIAGNDKPKPKWKFW